MKREKNEKHAKAIFFDFAIAIYPACLGPKESLNLSKKHIF